jgi:hypothetical protein
VNVRAISYDRLMVLADSTRDLHADLDRLARLVDYAWSHDTAGLVPVEIAGQLLAADPAVVDRLHSADLLHAQFDVDWCRCGTPGRPACWSLHDFHALADHYGSRDVAAH